MVIVGSQGGEMGSVLGGSRSIEVHLNNHILEDDYDGNDMNDHDHNYDHDDHDDYHGLSVANMAIESCTAWRRIHLVKRQS